MAVREMDSRIGRLLLRADEYGICEIRLLKADDAAEAEREDSELLEEAQRQLCAYLAGKRKVFDFPLSVQGTPFEQTVWQQLRQIPYGEARTYAQIAAQIGRPKAARAVGAACGRNPVLLAVPCHRVVGGTGRLTGFAAGLEAKRILLALEGHEIRNDRIKCPDHQ